MKNPSQTYLLLFFLCCQVIAFGQSGTTVNLSKDRDLQIELVWQPTQFEASYGARGEKFLSFESAAFTESLTPYIDRSIPVKEGEYEVELLDLETENVEFQSVKLIRETISNTFTLRSNLSYSRKKPVLHVTVFPFRKVNGKVERIKRCKLRLKRTPKTSTSKRSSLNYTDHSVLAEGAWFKVGVTGDGIYKVDKAFLEGLGMTVGNPANFSVYGNGGGMIPVQNNMPRTDDLAECAIFSSDDNGVLDADDYFLFYGEGPHRWSEGANGFTHTYNVYSDTTYYFFTFDKGTGKRINSAPIITGAPSGTVNSFDDYRFYEKEEVNLIKSGRRWFGEHFNVLVDYNFSFAFPNLVTSTPVSIFVQAASHSVSTPSTFTTKVNGSTLFDFTPAAVGESYTSKYAQLDFKEAKYTSSSDNLVVAVSYDKANSGAEGWLDFIEVNARRSLVYTSGLMAFRDLETVGNGINEFQMTTDEDVVVWDITDHHNISSMNLSGMSGGYSFLSDGLSLHEFAAFSGSDFIPPVAFGEVTNQDLHATGQPDYVILVHPLFMAQAEELAEYHTENGLEVLVVTPRQVYNEFSSGAQDITAIKDFLRMLYERAGTDSTLFPDYLMLFGDGSFDPKYRITGNTNFIPSYHAINSLTPTSSYVSDDYFGLLDPGESDEETDIVDVGIGRFPVKTVQEAQEMVAKVKAYASETSMRSWRNWLAFIGDDEDSNEHMKNVDALANLVDTMVPDYNLDKIYLDAYPQRTNAGGDRYPDVNAAINKRMDLGSLILTYVGHGGELGWGHERILEMSDIAAWDNVANMPLFLTATCEFSRYDDPGRTSAGENVLLNATGGAIALLTTTRLVYSSPNYELAENFFKNAFVTLGDGQVPRLGDLCRMTKIGAPKNVNSRNFTLLGDPAVKLAYPKHNVVTTSISKPEMNALSKITVSGEVRDENNVRISAFNGVVYPTVFDKESQVETLNNDGDGVFEFATRKNIIFKGKASVKAGRFSFEFVVPKDIDYRIDTGRISYYIEDDIEDGNGYDESFVIGGIDSLAAADTEGPTVELFMNDESFVFGGLTDQSPELFAKISDENGINTVGNGIGHDLLAILDGNTADAIELNDFYESDIDSYQSGTVRYQLSDLSDGMHTLSLKVWDVYNNSGEGYTEFVVADNASLALSHVLNYPNPFTTNTDFYFEHNQPGRQLTVRLEIFTVSGKIVKTFDTFTTGDSYRVGPINWNGLDEYGDKIGKGVYIYRLNVISPTGEQVDKFEKLVILR